MKGKALALLLLLGVAALVAPTARAETVEDDDEYEDVDASAFLLVRRKLSDDRPQVGKVVTVLVEVHNAGKADAQKVSVKEEAWRPDEFLTEGQLEAEYDTIPAGTTQAFSYSITPKQSSGVLTGPTTLVTYIAEEGGKPVTTKGPAVYIHVHTTIDMIKYKVLETGASLTFGMLVTQSDWLKVITIVGGAALVYLALNAQKKVSESRAKSRHLRALKDLGVTEEDLKKTS